MDDDNRDDASRESGLIRAEVLLVVAILAMLAAVAVPARQDDLAAIRVRTDEVHDCLVRMRDSIQRFHRERGRYPLTLEDPDFVALLTDGRLDAIHDAPPAAIPDPARQLEAARGGAPARDPAATTPISPDERTRLPPNPACGGRSVRIVSRMPDAPVGSEAWIYCPHTGEVHANLRDRSPDGIEWFRL